MPRRATSTSFGGERGNTPVPGPGVAKGNTHARFRKEMQKRVLAAKTLRRLDETLKAEDDRTFLAAFSECANRAFGKPEQAITGADGGSVQVNALLVLPPEAP